MGIGESWQGADQDSESGPPGEALGTSSQYTKTCISRSIKNLFIDFYCVHLFFFDHLRGIKNNSSVARDHAPHQKNKNKQKEIQRLRSILRYTKNLGIQIA
jgi:hypothetical protein